MQNIPAKKITISKIHSAIEKEPLAKPFGFKGGYLSELWQIIAHLESRNGHTATGIGTQSVLWSDSSVFTAHSESDGNVIMYSITQKALEIIKGKSFQDPIALLDSILDEVYDYGKKVTGRENLRETFVLNALVPVDNAVWLLYARENGMNNFDDMIPPAYRAGLAVKHDKIAYVPIVSYNDSMEELKKSTLHDGSFVIKIKLGQPGNQEEMLEKDKAHFTRIHEAIGNFKTPHTQSGKIVYYFDANGRYESKERVKEFLEHTKNIGAFGQIVIFEEPFSETHDEDVSDLGVRISADESAHTDVHVMNRIKKGYTAIALKPIAKTLSMTLKMIKKAHENNVACFCADLTVNPILVEWNKNISARIAPIPDMSMGLLETNGEQNYKYWEKMGSYSPSNGAPWTKINNGIFDLGKEYYAASGGIFKNSDHYDSLVKSSFNKK